jgi:hypothetical protein
MRAWNRSLEGIAPCGSAHFGPSRSAHYMEAGANRAGAHPWGLGLRIGLEMTVLFKFPKSRSCLPLSCGHAGQLRSNRMPSRSHHTANCLKPPSPTLANGVPLSLCIVTGIEGHENLILSLAPSPLAPPAYDHFRIRNRTFHASPVG